MHIRIIKKKQILAQTWVYFQFSLSFFIPIPSRNWMVTHWKSFIFPELSLPTSLFVWGRIYPSGRKKSFFPPCFGFGVSFVFRPRSLLREREIARVKNRLGWASKIVFVVLFLARRKPCGFLDNSILKVLDLLHECFFFSFVSCLTLSFSHSQTDFSLVSLSLQYIPGYSVAPPFPCSPLRLEKKNLDQTLALT